MVTARDAHRELKRIRVRLPRHLPVHHVLINQRLGADFKIKEFTQPRARGAPEPVRDGSNRHVWVRLAKRRESLPNARKHQPSRHVVPRGNPRQMIATRDDGNGVVFGNPARPRGAHGTRYSNSRVAHGLRRGVASSSRLRVALFAHQFHRRVHDWSFRKRLPQPLRAPVDERLVGGVDDGRRRPEGVVEVERDDFQALL
mmetsp:Transcript_507/g.2059  ORF Transcript_507/g.2059 Transcript_507/m.2059 type:complete len:200 (-) Transcript_507:125-724(-)